MFLRDISRRFLQQDFNQFLFRVRVEEYRLRFDSIYVTLKRLYGFAGDGDHVNVSFRQFANFQKRR